jgi:hypothetical protein
MLPSFVYLDFSAVLKLLLGQRRGEFAKDVELLVLRRQLVLLGRQAGRPSLRPADRAFPAALARCFRGGGRGLTTSVPGGCGPRHIRAPSAERASA